MRRVLCRHRRVHLHPRPSVPAATPASSAQGRGCTLRAVTKGTGFSQQHLLKSKALEEMSGAALISAQEFFRQ